MKQFLTLLCCMAFGTLMAQEAMEVRRCADIDRRVPIRNIYIDEENNKWVADQQGLFLAQSPEFASNVDIDPSQWSLLSVRDGNRELNLPKEELQQLMGDDFSSITTAHIDKAKGELWIGTSQSGLYQFSLKPKLRLLGQKNSGNSKLRSNNIRTIYSSITGQIIFGTDDGLMIQKGSKTSSVGKYFSIDAITSFGAAIWLLSDNEVLELDRKGKLYALELNERMVEGTIVDIAFDSQGRLWVASEIISRYNFETDDFQSFGPAEDFTSQFVNFIAVDGDDALWVGTEDKGVYFIGKASTLSASVVVGKPLGCTPGSKDAGLQVRASGGQPPYEYQWAGGLSGPQPQGLGPGTYQVTVSDQKGKSAAAEIVIPDPSMTVNTRSLKEASPEGGTDGQAEVTVEGGNPPYKYAWDNGETTQVAQQLPGGEHSVTITDQNGCQLTSSITITEALGALTLALKQEERNLCAGDSTASLKATVTGGLAPYQYNWSDARFNGEVASKLTDGNYQLTVTDAAGGKVQIGLVIQSPKKLIASITPTQPATTDQADGKATVKADGGNGTYTYQWDTGESSDKASKLAAGTHTVTITDENGCSTTASIDITEDILPLSVDLNAGAAIKCTGQSTASIQAEVSGGKGPFQYQWSNNAQAAKLDGLAAGKYQLTVTDAVGTTRTANINIKEPEPLQASITPKSPANTDQADGKANVKAKGGSGKYTYQWDNGESSNKASKLAVGTRTVTVTDENGCTTTASIDITEDILPLSVDLNAGAAIKCAGQSTASIQAEVSGGKGPFQYQWSNNAKGVKLDGLAAGEYQLTVTDAVGTTTTKTIQIEQPKPLQATITPKASANTDQADGKASVKAVGGSGQYTYQWDTNETGSKASKLAAGTHTVTITDGNGCSTTASIDVTEDILPLSVSINQTSDIACAGQSTASIETEIAGGKRPFQYQWSNDISGAKANGLAAGEYLLTITDAKGSTATSQVTISEPKALTVQASVDASATTNNSDGKASAKVSGGTTPYTYKWDNGETTAQATRLAPGQVGVTISDAKGCKTQAEVTISENILPLSIQLELSQAIKCKGDKTAAISLNTKGGKSPFSYKWDKASFNGTALTDLGADTYSVTVTDASGQSQEATLEVTEPDALTLELSKNLPATNKNSKDGRANIDIQGGTPDYVINWDNGETTAEAKKLIVGSHGVTVTDANGCRADVQMETKKKILPALTAGRLRAGQTLQVSQIYFEADSANMTEASFEVLEEIADFLKENPLIVIEVGGHTNNIPPPEFCDRLSTARAKEVATYIVQQGVDGNRVVYKGYGKRKPKYSNRTDDGRRRNQRVEIKVLSLD
ncbi:MAG: OmpA family protein [Bacteroidota bacterium]